MDQSDIHDIISILKDAILDRDWDKVEEGIEALKEFLDSDSHEDE